MSLPAPTALLAAGAHNGCPPPNRPWLGRQSWQTMFLAHWPVPVAVMQELLPRGLTIDTIDGKAWVSVVAYRMAHVRLRGMPEAMSLRFEQLNLRTYVQVGGKKGIYFFSLDAASPLAVRAGALVTGLPYHSARMRLAQDGGIYRYDSVRPSGGPIFRANYEPLGAMDQPTALDRFLTERYVFYADWGDGRLGEGAVCHGPWPLKHVRGQIIEHTIGQAQGLDLSGPPAHSQYSPGVDVLFWRPRAR